MITVFPEGAMQLAKKTTLKMADIVTESIQTSQSYLHSRDSEDYDVVMQLEEMVNKLDTEITSYLLKIMKQSGNSADVAETYTKTLEIVKNYERMSDLSTNLVELYNMTVEGRETFSEEAMEDIDTMYKLLLDMLHRSMKIYQNEDSAGYELLLQDEEYMDLIEDKYREKHFRRLADGICDTKFASSVFVDVLSTLERIADHGVNVARNVNSAVKMHSSGH
ncbi:PhoU domain-containing protein [Erysipelothrix larvae]|uniref:PhoU domain-containing protein n=1 Tax=Erysipelothrix larvae TaxID=1514105 RepID=UPI001E383EF1|nr:PhoU domain-containing protein [Erysipelothrix larvae]